MCVCVCVCVHVYVCLPMCVCIHACVCLFMYPCMSVCVSVCVSTNGNLYTQSCSDSYSYFWLNLAGGLVGKSIDKCPTDICPDIELSLFKSFNWTKIYQYGNRTSSYRSQLSWGHVCRTHLSMQHLPNSSHAVYPSC